MKRQSIFFLFFLSIASNVQGMRGGHLPPPGFPTPPPRPTSQQSTMPPARPTSVSMPTSPVRSAQPMSPAHSPAKFSTAPQQHQSTPSSPQSRPTSYQAPTYKFPTWRNPIALWQERRATSYMKKQTIDPKFSTEMEKLKGAPATIQKKGLEVLQAIEKNEARLAKIKQNEATLLQKIKDNPRLTEYKNKLNDRITKFINYVDGITNPSIPKDQQLSYKERNKTLLDFASDKDIAIMRKYQKNDFSSDGFTREENFKINNLIQNSLNKGIISKELQKEQMEASRINQQKRFAETEAAKLADQRKQLFGKPSAQ
ncbi:hypothetical protein K2W90_05225 [Candidatus Babeliales bacterium]|nr:hypothetical protein [Candidatus Babeliales bacterium]